MRYYFEAFALLVITILLQVFVSLTLVELRDFDTLNPTYLANRAIEESSTATTAEKSTATAWINANYDEYSSSATTGTSHFSTAMVVAFFSFFTLIRIVLERMFTLLTKRPFNSQNMFIYIDLATFVTFLVLLGRYFSVYRDGVSAVSGSTDKDILFMQNVAAD